MINGNSLGHPRKPGKQQPRQTTPSECLMESVGLMRRPVNVWWSLWAWCEANNYHRSGSADSETSSRLGELWLSYIFRHLGAKRLNQVQAHRQEYSYSWLVRIPTKVKQSICQDVCVPMDNTSAWMGMHPTSHWMIYWNWQKCFLYWNGIGSSWDPSTFCNNCCGIAIGIAGAKKLSVVVISEA